MNKLTPLLNQRFTNLLKFSYNKRFYAKIDSRNNLEDYDDGPIKYSTSPASKYKASTSRTGTSEPRLWYEPYVLIGSISALLIYFCVLREENDLDAELSRTLYSRIEGLEEVQLQASLDYNIRNGLETGNLIKRLEEIRQEKLAKQK